MIIGAKCEDSCLPVLPGHDNYTCVRLIALFIGLSSQLSFLIILTNDTLVLFPSLSVSLSLFSVCLQTDWGGGGGVEGGHLFDSSESRE